MYQIRTDLALETQEKMQALKKVLRENQSLLLDVSWRKNSART